MLSCAPLQVDERPTKLAQAVAEIGRVDKTLHALAYLDDEEQRRHILSQLNRGEDRHRLARAASSTANAGNSANATTRVRRTNSVPWVPWSTCSCFGTPSTSMPP